MRITAFAPVRRIPFFPESVVRTLSESLYPALQGANRFGPARECMVAIRLDNNDLSVVSQNYREPCVSVGVLLKGQSY